MSIASAASAVLGFLTTAGEKAPLVIGFIQNSVSAAEQTGKSGTDKMTAVLNASEAFVNGVLPDLEADIEEVMKAVEDFANEVVAIYNAAGVFMHGLTGKSS